MPLFQERGKKMKDKINIFEKELEEEKATSLRLLKSNIELRRKIIELEDQLKDKNIWISIFLSFNILAIILLYLKNV